MKYPSPEDLQGLSAADRLRLIEDLWETFEADPGSLPFSEEHAQKIDQRLSEWQANPTAGEFWPEVRRRITQK